MGPGNGPGFASTFITNNMEEIEGEEEDNVFKDNSGKEEEEGEEDLSDMQVFLHYLYLHLCLYSMTEHSTPALIRI